MDAFIDVAGAQAAAGLAKTMIKRSRTGRRGQGMVEFALILVLVACVAIVTITLTGNQLFLTFQDIEEAVANPGDAGATSAYTCPDGTTAVLHGHKFHCH